MNSFLALLLKLFGSQIDLVELFSQLAAKLLEGVTDSSGCKERLLQLIRTQTLDDEFKKNPLGIVLCMLHVVLAIADAAGAHTHENGAVMFADPWMSEMATALKIKPPANAASAVEARGIVANLILQQLITMLLEMLKNSNLQQKLLDLINEWLKKSN